jgi:hypothetical protein
MAYHEITPDNTDAANELYHNMSALFAPEMNKVAELNRQDATKKAEAASAAKTSKKPVDAVKTASAISTARTVPKRIPFAGILDSAEKLASSDSPLPVLGHLEDGTPVTAIDVMRHPAFKLGWEKRAMADVGFWDRLMTIQGAPTE